MSQLLARDKKNYESPSRQEQRPKNAAVLLCR